MKILSSLSYLTLFAAAASLASPPRATPVTLENTFKSMSSYRGPMGKNIIQGTGGRAITPSSPSGNRLFQGVFRSNDSGRFMAREFDFYVGNLFTSNYYELMETYVFGIESNNDQSDTADYNPRRNIEEEKLLAKGAEAMPRAASMVRHWVLEKYYVSKFPDSTLALSFQRWGAGDSADEQDYASRFFNFYLSSMTSDLQFLPAYLLIRQSPVGDSDQSPSLQKARDLVASYPNDRESLLGRIRNAIHNQLSPNVIAMIDQYKSKNGGLPDALVQVRKILVNFFSFSPAKSAVIAKRLQLTEMERLANVLASDDKNGRVSSLVDMLAFSEEAAKLRNAIGSPSVNPSQKSDALLLLSYASQFLNSRLTNDKAYPIDQLKTPETARTVLNAIYIEGLLIQRNWEYFSNKLKGAQSSEQIQDILAQATKIGGDTLVKSVAPALEQWKSIEAKMDGFLDNTIKSSSLNTTSVILSKIRN